MMTEDPWRDIVAPAASQVVNARRVDADLPWDFFWAKDVDGHCLLTLTYGHGSEPAGPLPTLKDIEVSGVATSDEERTMLIFRLTDATEKDLFYKLCRDIVDSTHEAQDETDAVARAVRRTWRWHHLLRQGTVGRLSTEEQKGLIGELFVLERHLLDVVGAADAVAAWRGPLQAPKDFELGGLCIEAKARRGPAKPFVAISSEYQLDPDGTDGLFLHVLEVDRAPADDADAVTVTVVAKRVLDAVIASDYTQEDAIETLLAAAGFRWEDDYTEFRWIEGDAHVYEVHGDFPRLSPEDIRTGVVDVRYTISLAECAPFEVTVDTLKAALTEVSR